MSIKGKFTILNLKRIQIDHMTIKMRNCVCIFLIATFSFSCETKNEKLKRDGFQIFEKYTLAIKTPCELKLDSIVSLPNEGLESITMVCPQIFSDSNRVNFDLFKLMESGNIVHHLTVLEQEKNIEIDSLLIEQIRIVSHLGAVNIKEIEIDTQKGVTCYFKDRYTCQAYIPREGWNYYISISSHNAEEDLEELLKTVIFTDLE